MLARSFRAPRRALREDTKPGQALALALLANAPIAVAFILAPVFTGGDARAGLAFLPAVVWLTPLFAAASLVVVWRAPAERRAHRAARIGVVLDVVALLLWALVLVAPR